jgi:hypothetical protein
MIQISAICSFVFLARLGISTPFDSFAKNYSHGPLVKVWWQEARELISAYLKDLTNHSRKMCLLRENCDVYEKIMSDEEIAAAMIKIFGAAPIRCSVDSDRNSRTFQFELDEMQLDTTSALSILSVMQDFTANNRVPPSQTQSNPNGSHRVDSHTTQMCNQCFNSDGSVKQFCSDCQAAEFKKLYWPIAEPPRNYFPLLMPVVAVKVATLNPPYDWDETLPRLTPPPANLVRGLNDPEPASPDWTVFRGEKVKEYVDLVREETDEYFSKLINEKKGSRRAVEPEALATENRNDSRVPPPTQHRFTRSQKKNVAATPVQGENTKSQQTTIHDSVSSESQGDDVRDSTSVSESVADLDKDISELEQLQRMVRGKINDKLQRLERLKADGHTEPASQHMYFHSMLDNLKAHREIQSGVKAILDTQSQKLRNAYRALLDGRSECSYLLVCIVVSVCLHSISVFFTQFGGLTYCSVYCAVCTTVDCNMTCVQASSMRSF